MFFIVARLGNNSVDKKYEVIVNELEYIYKKDTVVNKHSDSNIIIYKFPQKETDSLLIKIMDN